MSITDERIDGGKAFDWGKTSTDYARFRDIYPQKFYDKIIERKLCIRGQVRISQKTRLNRRGFFQKAWIVHIMHSLGKKLISQRAPLM